MKTFVLTAKVRRREIDTVTLKVEAHHLNMALMKAREVLNVYPKGHDIKGVSFCLVENRDRFDEEVLSIEEAKRYA